jgi:uncharacterized damage-inducible protein DinB
MDNDSLITYELWALRRMLDAVERSPGQSYKAQLIMAHIINAYRLWHDRMAGRKPSTGPWDERSIEECRTMLSDLDRDYRTLLEESSSPSVAYTNTKGVAFENTREEILQHLVLHSAYHRGQVNMIIRQSGGEPAVVDYILYVREGDRA